MNGARKHPPAFGHPSREGISLSHSRRVTLAGGVLVLHALSAIPSREGWRAATGCVPTRALSVVSGKLAPT